MRFIFDNEKNSIFEGSILEIKELFIFINEYSEKNKIKQDLHLLNLLKDVNIKEENETKN